MATRAGRRRVVLPLRYRTNDDVPLSGDKGNDEQYKNDASDTERESSDEEQSVEGVDHLPDDSNDDEDGDAERESSDEDLLDGSDDDEDGSLNSTAGSKREHGSNEDDETAAKRRRKTTIDLQCMASIRACFPRRIQPPPQFRSSIEKVQEFMDMPKLQQWAKRREFQNMDAWERLNHEKAIPGAPCTNSCCVRKQRSDAGRARKRKSSRLLHSSTNNEHGGVSGRLASREVAQYASLSGSASDRAPLIEANQPKAKYKSQKSWEFSRTPGEQSGKKATDAMFRAIRATVQAATQSIMEPKVNAKTSEQIFDVEGPTCMNSCLVAFLREAAPPRSSGGKSSFAQLKADKPQLFLYYPDSAMAKKVIDAIYDSKENPDSYEKFKAKGVGKVGIQNLAAMENSYRADRKRGEKTNKTVEETAAAINNDIAITRD